MALSQFNNFKETLAKVFMLDHAELDFGIYRILNHKRTEIENYLNNTLASEVKQVLEDNMGSRVNELQTQLHEAENQARALGVDPNTVQRIQDLRQQIAAEGSPEDMENDVYSHLSTFLRRYYDDGDFISQRRYKKDVYAIPYEGEEVKLHWANADQYYIKTSEYFRTYNFKLSDGKLVEFNLKEASTEQNNNQNTSGKDRRFAIYEDCPVEVEGKTLHINFTYELMPKATKQKDLMTAAFETTKPLIPAEFAEVFSERPTENNAYRTLLEKHITDYVSRNTFDYFIHKDLKGFLSRELDFYIKNEVLFIDDINAKEAKEFTQHLTVIKALKTIGEKIIEFLSQIENFQKKLWLKKKFVTDCNWCLTLDRIPESFYGEIAANDAQREEWVRLFAIDEIKGDLLKEGYSVPLPVKFLKDNPYLLLDTAFFNIDFMHKLLAQIENIDIQCDGILIKSENYQALNFLQEKFKQQINGIYVDPPYNTSASEIIYKNSYKKSSWMSLIQDRIVLGKQLLTKDAVQCTTIDDFQFHELNGLLNSCFGIGGVLGTVIIKSNPQGRSSATGFQISHEYGIFNRNEDGKISRLERNSDQLARYNLKDEYGPFEWRNFRAQYSQESATMVYPIFIKKDCSDFRLPAMEWDEENSRYIMLEEPLDDEFVSMPIDDTGRMRTWKWAIPTVTRDKDKHMGVRRDRQGNPAVYYKGRMKDLGMLPFTIWDKPEYSASTFGANFLSDIIGTGKFSYPKSIHAVIDSIKVETDNPNAIILDYFAGSGTTGHAVINLNRDDKENGHRKYILVEMGEYFNTVTKPRIQKVIYSKDWSKGMPVDREGISQCFKYMRLESYEDTLNNLVTKTPSSDIFSGSGQYKESYLIGYMLDMETKESLFNSKWFEHPFDVKLKVTQNNELIEQKVDLVETFNYLIGLYVETMQWPRDGICIVEGKTRKGDKALVIWRDMEKIDNAKLDDIFSRLDFSTRDSEFDRIYINGDNNLQNLRTDESHWKVLLTEEEFEKAMFSE